MFNNIKPISQEALAEKKKQGVRIESDIVKNVSVEELNEVADRLNSVTKAIAAYTGNTDLVVAVKGLSDALENKFKLGGSENTEKILEAVSKLSQTVNITQENKTYRFDVQRNNFDQITTIIAKPL